MVITLHACPKCGRRKIFWLKRSDEESFHCSCSSRKTKHHFDASYEDYFIDLMRGPITVEGLAKLARSEAMSVDPADLKVKLQAFDLEHLSEGEFYEVAGIVLACDDLHRFRNLLVRVTDRKGGNMKNPCIFIGSMGIA